MGHCGRSIQTLPVRPIQRRTGSGRLQLRRRRDVWRPEVPGSLRTKCARAVPAASGQDSGSLPGWRNTCSEEDGARSDARLVVWLEHLGVGSSASVGIADGQEGLRDREATASARVATCSGVCCAESVMRRRAVPSRTVGGRMGWTRIPLSRSWLDARRAWSSGPRIMGRMGAANGSGGRTRRKRSWVTRSRRARRRRSPSTEVIIWTAARAAAATGGGKAVVKRKGRAQLER